MDIPVGRGVSKTKNESIMNWNIWSGSREGEGVGGGAFKQWYAFVVVQFCPCYNFFFVLVYSNI